MALLQWNLNGYSTHHEEFRQLLSRIDPVIFCLQETHFTPTTSCLIRGYSLYRQDKVADGRAAGGAAIGISEQYHSTLLHVHMTFQTVAVRVFLNQPVTICCVYLPRSEAFTAADLENICRQLPAPVLMVGDFNAYNVLWWSNRTELRGREVATFMAHQTLILLNDGSPTHFTTATGSFSHIDLSLSSPALGAQLEWRVYPDLCGSDHFPLVITGLQIPQARPSSRYNLRQANWTRFSTSLAFLPDPT